MSLVPSSALNSSSSAVLFMLSQYNSGSPSPLLLLLSKGQESGPIPGLSAWWALTAVCSGITVPEKMEAFQHWWLLLKHSHCLLFWQGSCSKPCRSEGDQTQRWFPFICGATLTTRSVLWNDLKLKPDIFTSNTVVIIRVTKWCTQVLQPIFTQVKVTISDPRNYSKE